MYRALSKVADGHLSGLKEPQVGVPHPKYSVGSDKEKQQCSKPQGRCWRLPEKGEGFKGSFPACPWQCLLGLALESPEQAEFLPGIVLAL